MRLRNMILAGTGILTVCGIAVAISIRDYTTQPRAASAHVAPVGPPLASTSGPTSAPMPTTAVTAEPTSQPASVVPTEEPPPRPPATQSDTPASVLRQPEQRRDHSSPGDPAEKPPRGRGGSGGSDTDD